jgi:hypothetical protein
MIICEIYLYTIVVHIRGILRSVLYFFIEEQAKNVL